MGCLAAPISILLLDDQWVDTETSIVIQNVQIKPSYSVSFLVFLRMIMISTYVL
jgi:hypothetical protein